MGSETVIKPYQIVTVEDLLSIGVLKGSHNDILQDALNKKLTFACQILPTNPPNALINIGSASITLEDGRIVQLSPISGSLIAFTGATINVQTGAFTGNVNSFTFPVATAAGQYFRLGLQVDSTGFINLTNSLLGSSLGGSGQLPLLDGQVPLGYVDLVSTAAGTAYQGASAAVANSVAGADITQFYGESVPSTTASEAISPADGFNALVFDDLSSFPNASDSKVIAARTNAVYSNKTFIMSCDKTVSITTTGVNFSFASAPGYTIAPGDIISSGGVFREIATITSQTAGTLDVAFPVDLASASGMVSQAVWTKDLTTVGDPDASSFFPGVNVQSLNISYFDGMIVDGAVPEYGNAANVIVSGSNEGLTTDSNIPTTDQYSPSFARPPMPGQILNYPLIPNTNMQRLFLVFFPNPGNSAVTNNAVLFRHDTSFYPVQALSNGGFLNSAFVMTDGSGAAINCSLALEGSQSVLTLGFNFVPQINLGTTVGDISDVLFRGISLPRRVVGSTQDAWYEEYPGSTSKIRFWSNLQAIGATGSLEVRRRQGSIDTADNNTIRLASMYDAIVGSPDQVASGAASHSSWNAALAYVNNNGTILGLRATITENVVVNKNVCIMGLGYGTVIDGTLEFASSSSSSSASGFKITNNLTIDTGANALFISNVWQSSGFTITDSGIDNTVTVRQEP